MAALIDTISPGRGRATDIGVVIDGSGFSPTPTNNTVTVDGQAATITAESATQITITIPGSITEDRHVVVSVTNTDDSTVDTIFWWSKLNAGALATVDITGQIPGPFEDPDPTTESPDTAEAKDYEKLATLVEFVRGASGAIPTVGSWADNTETLSADKTLVDGDATIQALDPDGTDRNVIMPTLSDSTPFFVFINTGATANLKIKSGDSNVATILPGQVQMVFNTGLSGFFAGEKQGIERDFLLPFGADLNAFDRGLPFYGSPSGGVVNTPGVVTTEIFAAIPVDARLDSFSWRNAGTNFPAMVIFGGPATDNSIAGRFILTMESATGVRSFPPNLWDIAYSSVAMVTGIGGTGRFTSVVLNYRHGNADLGALFIWGSDDIGNAVHPLAHGPGDTAGSASLNQLTEQTMHKTGSLTRFVTFSNGTVSGASWRIHKNGALDTTLTATTGSAGPVFFEDISISFVSGDEFTVDKSGAGSEGHVLIFADYEGVLLGYGAVLSTTTRRAVAWGDATLTQITGDNVESEITIPFDSKPDAFAWNTASATATTVIRINKNGALDQDITLTGATGSDESLSATAYLEGDTQSMIYQSGVAPGQGNYNMLMVRD